LRLLQPKVAVDEISSKLARNEPGQRLSKTYAWVKYREKKVLEFKVPPISAGFRLNWIRSLRHFVARHRV